jgi:phage terminase small subunit
VEVPKQFDADTEFGLTEMQTAFVWHYSQGGCGQTEAARRAGFSFPGMSASKLMNGRDHPNVVKAIRAEQEEMRQKYAITPAKTGAMLWKIAEVSFESGAYNAAVSAVKELEPACRLDDTAQPEPEHQRQPGQHDQERDYQAAERAAGRE